MAARILIIEDDLASRELARYLLRQAGHAVLLAADGREGLRSALADLPDLVLSDMQLPSLSGVEVCAALRGTARWRRVPMIAVTASTGSLDRAAALDAGFDGYIAKPIAPETFVEQVEAFLSR